MRLATLANPLKTSLEVGIKTVMLGSSGEDKFKFGMVERKELNGFKRKGEVELD